MRRLICKGKLNLNPNAIPIGKYINTNPLHIIMNSILRHTIIDITLLKHINIERYENPNTY